MAYTTPCTITVESYDAPAPIKVYDTLTPLQSNNAVKTSEARYLNKSLVYAILDRSTQSTTLERLSNYSVVNRQSENISLKQSSESIDCRNSPDYIVIKSLTPTPTPTEYIIPLSQDKNRPLDVCSDNRRNDQTDVCSDNRRNDQTDVCSDNRRNDQTKVCSDNRRNDQTDVCLDVCPDVCPDVCRDKYLDVHLGKQMDNQAKKQHKINLAKFDEFISRREIVNYIYTLITFAMLSCIYTILLLIICPILYIHNIQYLYQIIIGVIIFLFLTTLIEFALYLKIKYYNKNIKKHLSQNMYYIDKCIQSRIVLSAIAIVIFIIYYTLKQCDNCAIPFKIMSIVLLLILLIMSIAQIIYLTRQRFKIK